MQYNNPICISLTNLGVANLILWHKLLEYITRTIEYRFKINGANGSTDEAAASQYFKELLGEDAIISYQYVNESLQLSSGKHQKVVSNYKKNK